MGEPIKAYTPDGEVVIVASPRFLGEQVASGKLFISPVTATFEVVDEEAVAQMIEAFGLDEEE